MITKAKELKAALLQILPGKAPEETLQKRVDFCHRAEAVGADTALFREMRSNGYAIPLRWEDGQAQAVNLS